MRDREKIKVNQDGGGAWFIGVAMLIIAFWGEPDLIDAIKHYLFNS